MKKEKNKQKIRQKTLLIKMKKVNSKNIKKKKNKKEEANVEIKVQIKNLTIIIFMNLKITVSQFRTDLKKWDFFLNLKFICLINL